MKKPTLISALAVAALAAASLVLPGTASAASFKEDGMKNVHSEQHRDRDRDRDHRDRRDGDRRHGEHYPPKKHGRLAPSPHYRHDRDRHYGYGYSYGPVKRHHHHDDLWVRFLYDLHR